MIGYHTVFNKDYKTKFYDVHIHISNLCLFESTNFIIFGNAYNFVKEDVLLSPADFGNKLKGNWLRIDFTKQELVITNDILGGFRIYYSIQSNKIIISDDYNYVIEKFKLPLQINKIEYDYWLKHRYTTGKSTFLRNVFKLSPCSSLIINQQVNEETYIKDTVHKPNQYKHKELIHDDLLDTFRTIKKSKKKKILFFSGGKDSCLLLNYLLHLNIPFTPVFLKILPLNKSIKSDLIKVRSVAAQLMLNVDEIEVYLDQISVREKDEIIKTNFFDRHFAVLHYLGVKKIREKYGKDCLIINGQSSDSILSYGPSDNTIISFIRRNILYKPKSFISKIGLILLNIRTRNLFKLPKNDTESLIALFDEFKYTRVIDKNLKEDYLTYIENYIKSKTDKIKSFETKEMLTKIISFCQGSDNQIVINSAKYYGIDVIMPFATPKIIYSTIQFKDKDLEIKKSKYVVDDILKKEFKFNYETIKINKKKIDDSIIDKNNATAGLSFLFIEKAQKIVRQGINSSS